MIRYKEVFTGSICNNDCAVCPNASPRSGRPLAEILEEIGEPDGAVDSVVLVGGEPALRNDLDEMAKEARARGWRRMKIVTNARPFANPQAAVAVLEAGIHAFEIKLFGHAPQIHDAITRQEGSFAETVQGLLNLRAMRNESAAPLFLHFRIGVTTLDYPYLSQMLAFAMQLSADRVTFRLEDPALSLVEAAPHVKQAIEMGLVNSLWAQTERLPLCFMDGYEHHVREAFDAVYEERARVEACKSCAYLGCSGLWPRYLESHSASEILPALESRLAAKTAGDAG